MDHEEARTIGRRVRQIRFARRKPLRVIAGLAGMSTTKLHRIEHGEYALDRIPEIVALANALQIAPSELMRLPIPAPANGDTDTATEAIRLALDAVEVDDPAGLVLPVAALRDHVRQLHQQRRECRFAEVATALATVIRNVHTTLDAGTDRGELLDLAVYLHVHVTRLWLSHAGASADLVRRVAFLARRLARERDEVTTLGVAGFGVVTILQDSGAFALGRAKLDRITPPPTTADTAGLVCNLTLAHAYDAVMANRPGDMTAPMEAAAEVAARFETSAGTDSSGFVTSPVDVALHGMTLALEANDTDRALRIARDINPDSHPFRVGRAQYWRNYGRALARQRGRHDDAVKALRRAEGIFPAVVLRDPRTREVLGELMTRSRRDAVGRELRGMAYRAGLPGI